MQFGLVVQDYAKVVGYIKLEVITVIAQKFAASDKRIILACQVLPSTPLSLQPLNEVLKNVPLTFGQDDSRKETVDLHPGVIAQTDIADACCNLFYVHRAILDHHGQLDEFSILIRVKPGLIIAAEDNTGLRGIALSEEDADLGVVCVASPSKISN